MAVDTIFFVPLDSTLVKPVDRFLRVIRQNACFGTRMCLWGFRKINNSVFTPKIAKTQKFGALSNIQCISYGKQKCYRGNIITFEP